MIYYPQHLKHQYTATDSTLEEDVAYDTHDSRPLLTGTSKPKVTLSSEWRLSITLAWVVAVHLCVILLLIPASELTKSKTICNDHNVLSPGQHTHPTFLQSIGPVAPRNLIMGDFSWRLLRHALCNSVCTAVGTHIQDEGCGCT